MGSSLPDYYLDGYPDGIAPLQHLLNLMEAKESMTNTPQNVTSRYTRNLLVKGENNEYIMTTMNHKTNMVDELVIGYYYTAEVITKGPRLTKLAIGVTPEQAVHRCLEKHGVTFR